MNHSFQTRLQRMLLALTLALAAGWALALPSPKDIEAAVGAGQLPQAETMLREVLQAKPQSAKAHYELGQVLARQGKYFEAQQALDQAKTIDSTLKFATSPEAFAKTYDTVLAQVRGTSSAKPPVATVASPAAPVAQAAPASPAPSGGFNLMYVWIAAAGLVVLGLVLRRRAAAAPAMTATAAHSVAPAGMPPAGQPTTYTGATMATGGIIGSGLTPAQAAAPAQRGFGAQYAPQTPAPGHYPPAAAPAAGGMGAMGGAVLGGVAGLAAGYALSKAMEGGANQTNPAAGNNAANPAHDSAGYVPFDNPSRPDMGAFDAGAGGDSWDVGQAPMDDDEW